MSYYGPGPYPQGPTMFNNKGPKLYTTPYIRSDIDQNLAEIVERTKNLRHDYEYTKVRWAAAGWRIEDVQTEMDRLELGKPMCWDPQWYYRESDDPKVHVSLAQVYPELLRSAEDRKTA